jgi:hypothetical protein
VSEHQRGSRRVGNALGDDEAKKEGVSLAKTMQFTRTNLRQLRNKTKHKSTDIERKYPGIVVGVVRRNQEAIHSV